MEKYLENLKDYCSELFHIDISIRGLRKQMEEAAEKNNREEVSSFASSYYDSLRHKEIILTNLAKLANEQATMAKTLANSWQVFK